MKHRPSIATTSFHRAILVLAAVAVCCASVGCQGYHLGNRNLYLPDVRTVYVPIAESDSYRPFLGERLTEAVVREINDNTTYRVTADSTYADSLLRMRVLSDSKHVAAENRYDDPRELDVGLYVEAAWVDRHDRQLEPVRRFAFTGDLELIDTNASLVPETGQSVATSQQRAIERMAQQIVGMMEAPW